MGVDFLGFVLFISIFSLKAFKSSAALADSFLSAFDSFLSSFVIFVDIIEDEDEEEEVDLVSFLDPELRSPTHRLSPDPTVGVGGGVDSAPDVDPGRPMENPNSVASLTL